MLEGLDGVDWKGVEHAYGPATEVPAWLRAIAKAPKRGKAFSSFVSAVNHQGMATPAALPTVPFLVELVVAGAGPVAEITILLGDLAAAGDHTNLLSAGAEVVDAHQDGASLQEAVRAGLTVFQKLLRDSDPKVRAAAAVPLAMLGDRDGKTAEALGAAVDAEQKPEPLAACLLALAWLGRARPDRTTLARLDAHAKHKAAAVRAAAATGASWLDPSPERTRALAATVAKAPSAAAVPFGQGDLRGLAVAELAAASMRSGDANAFLDLNDELDLLPERELYGAVLAAIVPALEKSPVEPPLASDFSDAQRSVLVRLAARVSASKNESVPLDAFHERGIMDPVRLFGASARALPLDDVFDGEPLWRHARRTRDGRGEASRWRDVVERWAGGDLKKQEALAEDCFANGHVLSMPYPYAYDEPIAGQWTKNAAWGAMLGATLEGLAPKLLGKLAGGTSRSAAYAVAPWVRALGGELDATATKRVTDILGSFAREPSVGRDVLEALPAGTSEALAERCVADMVVADSERPPRVYLRGAWQWLDLSPALTTRMCEEVASWDDIPEAKDNPRMEEAIVTEVVLALGRGHAARPFAPALLARAKPAGRRILEQVIAAR